MSRVLHVLHGLGIGGAETWLVALLREFKRRGDVKAEVLLTCGEPRVLDGEVEDLGVPLHYLPYRKGHRMTFVRGWRRVLRSGAFDAVHDHQDIQSGAHFLLGAGALPKVRIAHFHNPHYQLRTNYGESVRRRMVAPVLQRLATGLATNLIGTSTRLLEEYGLSSFLEKENVNGAIHCGFDVAAFRADAQGGAVEVRQEFGWNRSKRLVLFVGRLDVSAEVDAPKNHKNSGLAFDLLLESMRSDPRVVALFAGKNDHTVALHEFRRRASEAGLGSRLRFIGIRSDVPRLMRAANVLLFPSRAEGLGMVAVEAQASGLPVVASTAVPEECSVVPGGVRFVDLKAGIEAWKSALKAALAEEPDRLAWNHAVRASAFDIRRSAAALEHLYRTGERLSREQLCALAEDQI